MPEILRLKGADGQWHEVAAIKGTDGDDYVLTEADKHEIADEVKELVPPYDDTEIRNELNTKANTSDVEAIETEITDVKQTKRQHDILSPGGESMKVIIELDTDKQILTHQELLDLICEQYYVYDTFEVISNTMNNPNQTGL